MGAANHSMRRQRLCSQRRRRPRRAEAAKSRLGRRRSDLCRHSRQRGESGRPQQRADGAESRWRRKRCCERPTDRAEVSPGDVQYVEAHGTGTLLGDPIEARALGAVLADGRPPGNLRDGFGQEQYGPSRSRRRHRRLDQGGAGAPACGDSAEPALPGAQPSYSLRRASAARADAAGSMARGDRSALAGVSSFGFGGTNAHVVLQQAPESPTSSEADRDKSGYLLPLSARSPEALQASREPTRTCSRPPHRRCRISVTPPARGSLITTTVLP